MGGGRVCVFETEIAPCTPASGRLVLGQLLPIVGSSCSGLLDTFLSYCRRCPPQSILEEAHTAVGRAACAQWRQRSPSRQYRFHSLFQLNLWHRPTPVLLPTGVQARAKVVGRSLGDRAASCVRQRGSDRSIQEERRGGDKITWGPLPTTLSLRLLCCLSLADIT